MHDEALDFLAGNDEHQEVLASYENEYMREKMAAEDEANRCLTMPLSLMD